MGACALALLVPTLAAAHAQKPVERALVQFRPDATELLYEASIPAGKDAAHWRLVGDVNRNGRLSAEELSLLAKTIAEAVARNLVVTLDGNALPVEVVDAKLVDAPSRDRLSGKLAVLAYLRLRSLPPGVRKTTWQVRPLVGGEQPVVLRFEPDPAGFRIQSLVGGAPVDLADAAPAVGLRPGQSVTLLVDVTAPPKPATKP